MTSHVPDLEAPPTTVGALIEHLKQFPAEIEVLHMCYSDYAPLRVAEVELVSGVPNESWVMRVYEQHIPTMSERNVQRMKQYLLFPGN